MLHAAVLFGVFTDCRVGGSIEKYHTFITPKPRFPLNSSHEFIFSSQYSCRRTSEKAVRSFRVLECRRRRPHVNLAPGEGFEPSRPQRTTGFVSPIPGLGSSSWDLPRTRLGNPGVSQPRLSTADQLPLSRHKDSHEAMIEYCRCLIAPHLGVCSSRHQDSHDLGGDSFLLLDHGFA